MNFYEILKTKKLGRGSPDYWTQLFAEHVGGKGEWKVAELTGPLPITFRSNGTTLIDYRVYGTEDGSGVQTENLFNFDEYDIGVTTFITKTLTLEPNTAYTMSSDAPRYNVGALIVLVAMGESTSTSNNGVYKDRPITKTTDASGKIRVGLRDNGSGYDLSIYKTMLVKGSTPPETFIPYGYKLPLTVTIGADSKTADIHIGDTKLMAGDYIDYESGKIYKAKRIHEDTVTIDGIEWDILDYDHDEVYKADGTRAKHTVTIQTHDIINELQYSARQAAFAFAEGLAAGTYKFTVGAHPWVAGDVNKVLTFTLTNAIPSGGQLVFNGAYNRTFVGTTISVFASPTSTTAAETVTMTEGNTGTDLGTILRSKTDTVNSIDRALNGSNNWLESAMRQFLNSDKAAGSVWNPQTIFDRPPTWALTTAGFLNGKSNGFVSHIGTAKKITGLNQRTDGGRTVVYDEKIFLLSRSEVYMGDEFAGGEGIPYAYYEKYSDHQNPSAAADENRIKYRADNVHNWWLRSSNQSDACSIRYVNLSGAWGGYYIAVYGVAPACCIVLDDMDDWVKQTFYTETTVDLPAIETFNGDNTLDSTETLGEVTIKGKIKPQS